MTSYNNLDIPTTPKKNTENKRYTESKIPSPSRIPSPKYFNSRNNSPNSSVSSSSTSASGTAASGSTMNDKELILHTKSSISNKSQQRHSSTLNSFYNENVKHLNKLNDEMVSKKIKLQELKQQRDELNAKCEDDLNLTVESLKKILINKKQQYKSLKFEIDQISENWESKLNCIQTSYTLKIEKLKADQWTQKTKFLKEYESKEQEAREKYQNDKKLLQNKVDMLKKEIKKVELELKENEDYKSKENDLKLEFNHEKEHFLKAMKLKQEGILKENERISINTYSLQNEINNKLQSRYDQLCHDTEYLEQEITTITQEIDIQNKDHSGLLEEYESIQLETKKMEGKYEEMGDYVTKATKELQDINEIIIKEEAIRRKLHNQLQEMRGNIRVFCRIKPMDDPNFHISVLPLDTKDGTQKLLLNGENTNFNANVEFKFDRIFTKKDTNSQVFGEVSQLVQSSLDGYSVCIFAYGQTGSGKTYTMLHEKDGIIPMTLKHIFEWIDKLKESGWQYKVTTQFVEIYNEQICDLLSNKRQSIAGSPSKNKIEIRNTPDGKTLLTNLVTEKIENIEDAHRLLQKALKTRTTAATNANDHSSRSHSIFIINLHGINDITEEYCDGILNLVDLAGSERLNSSLVTGDRLRETQNINRSLSCLGDVIHALGEKKSKHIPFRNSKLTYMLQNSLLGDSKTLMFVNVCENNYNETINSLRFASKVYSTEMKKRQT
ncbi:uncharacterized protein SCODWIG_01437 [Saccharomycodes ludwigii]|uniref:Kinesin motor domain-containing protein n=1 Tax=Saccharomycodes ludwigii TaxID=36035 RepID=A0A376B4Q4_9ASCO|nr:hypothetical protein SCDLUD_002445 [Saccharomycodes ludwigii]KAH3900981.1 hypothetical protein SCDLUD_002445 [Saccharomycodes ludwigii]SSD59676.1 uncharacterized protein SCODWIG_01437 [Saccharomycodes ludwigii]